MLKFLCWNVNGLRSIMQKGFVEVVRSIGPDFICLQEIKIKEPELSLALKGLEDYAMYSSCALKPGYSGVLTLVHKRFDTTPLKVCEGPEREKSIVAKLFEEEGRFLLLEFETFSLLNTYIPSGTSGEERQALKMEFLECFSSAIKQAMTAKKLIVCGDFNICHRPIDIHHPREAEKRRLTGFLPEERAWMDQFCSLGMVDAFRHMHGDKPQQYTWWTYRANARAKNLGWRIDYFFVSSDLCGAVKGAEILESIKGSDHCPITLTCHSEGALMI